MKTVILSNHLFLALVASSVPSLALAEGEAEVVAEEAEAGDDAAAAAAEEAMLAELMAEQAIEPEDGPSLRFYGFSDFTVQKFFLPDTAAWEGVFRDATEFYIGNLNLYLDADLTNNFTSLVEVRFLFTPTGNLDPNRPGLLDPTADSRVDPIEDYADAGRALDYGAIEIERVYVQYTLHSLARVRLGRFLTPWGIWNVDHGSPVIISTARPYVIGEGFFPEAQTGMEVFGNFGVGDATIGYHATMSNGRGPVEQYGDFDDNKAFGGRVWMNGRWLGSLTVGASAYYGQYSDERQEFDLAGGAMYPSVFMYEQYDEVAYAADAQFTYRSFHVQGEVAVHDRKWNDDARPNGQADNRRIGSYALLAYELPWLNLRPYTVLQYYNMGDNDGLGGARDLLVTEFGLNVRVTPNVVLKGSYSYVPFLNPQPDTLAAEDLHVVSSQLSWAF